MFSELPYPAFFLRQAIDALGGLLRVIERPADEVAGYALATMTSGERAGWILSMAVAPANRGSGLARSLLEDVVSQLAERGAGEVLLTVEPDNEPARRLYESAGFEALRAEPDYFGPGERRLVLRRQLEVSSKQ